MLALAGGAGGAVAIAAMEWLSDRFAFPLMFVPFATSIVLVMGSPDAEPAQPRALIGGHLISTLVGLIVLQLAGPVPWAAALAVGLAMVAMHLTRTFHPPAGIDPLVVVVNNMSLALPARAGGRSAPACSARSRSSGTTWCGAAPGRPAGGEAAARRCAAIARSAATDAPFDPA